MNETASSRTTIIAFAVIIIMILIGGVLLLTSRPAPVQITINPPEPTATDQPTPTPEPILVYVTGEVNEPEQTLTLPHNSRVQDAIDAAGGLTDAADLERVNLAGILRDGDQIHVPTIADESVAAEAEIPTPSGGGVIFINSATQEELQTLPGVGPAMAARIIEHREVNGNFTSFEDLDEVSGVGPAMIEDLQDLISFEQ